MSLLDNPKYYISSITMAVQDEIKKNFEKYLESRIEYYISLLFYNLQIPRHVTNFWLKIDNKEPIRFQNITATNNFFVVQNFDYRLLLTKLKPKRIVELVNAVLLERPIFIIDNDISEMAIIMNSLASLIKPFTWVAPLVPIIPKNSSGLIASPMGGMYGISLKMWEEWCEDHIHEMESHAYVLLIKNDQRIWEEKLEPIPHAKKLEEAVRQMRELINSNEKEWPIRKKWRKVFEDSEIDTELTENDLNVYSQLKLDQQFFLNIFWKTFKNLNEYIKFDLDSTKYKNKEILTWQLFDEEGFLETVEEDHKEFTKQVIHTQQFICFIDKAFRIKNNILEKDETDIDKIEYIFKSIATIKQHNQEMLEDILDLHLKLCIRDYYNNYLEVDLDDHKKQYTQELSSIVWNRFKDTKQYLIHETFINESKQLSALRKLNHQLIITKYDQSIYQEDNKQDDDWQNSIEKFSPFSQSEVEEAKKFNRSKSSRHIMLDGDLGDDKSMSNIDENSTQKPDIKATNLEDGLNVLEEKNFSNTQSIKLKYQKTNPTKHFSLRNLSHEKLRKNRLDKSASHQIQSTMILGRLKATGKSKTFKKLKHTVPRNQLNLYEDESKDDSLKYQSDDNAVAWYKYTRKHRNRNLLSNNLDKNNDRNTSINQDNLKN